MLVLSWHIQTQHFSQSNILKIQQLNNERCRSPENSQQERNLLRPQNRLRVLLVIKWERRASGHTSTVRTTAKHPKCFLTAVLQDVRAPLTAKLSTLREYCVFLLEKDLELLCACCDLRLLWLTDKYLVLGILSLPLYCTIVRHSCKRNAVFLLKDRDSILF